VKFIIIHCANTYCLFLRRYI